MHLRTSLASRLLLGGLVFTILVIVGVSGFLLISRNQQTETGALSNADNRAGVAGQLLTRVTQPQAQYAATELASLASMQTALAGATPADSVGQEFSSRRVVAVPGLDVVVFSASGTVLYTTECDASSAAGGQHVPTADCEARATTHVVSTLPAVQGAMQIAAKPACQVAPAIIASSTTLTAQCPTGAEGVELLAGDVPSFEVAVPVLDAQANTYAPLGVVVYSSPLRTQFKRFGPVIGYTPVFLSVAGTPTVVRYSGAEYTPSTASAPLAIAAGTRDHTSTYGGDAFTAHAIYAIPGAGDVAGSFTPLPAPDGRHVAGYLGVEVPLSLFAAGTAQDERTIAALSITAIIVCCLLVLVFVDRFVRRPVGRLERGVARIAAGDYTTDIPVSSNDELGRLATSVNSMRDQIAGYIRHIDGSIERLEDVSRALTTTTGGVESLQDAVLRAAAAIAGSGATAVLFVRRGDEFTAARVQGDYTSSALDGSTVTTLLAGEIQRGEAAGSHILAVPMFYQENVSGALVALTPQPVSDSDQSALVALANNGAVALENTRMFEQEKEAVQRLSELNQLKSDFLGTAQHELRTPVLAIQGQLELLTLAWDKWDDTTKMDIVRDVEISTKLLSEVVETIVDFSLLSAETLDFQKTAVDVALTVDAAVADVRAHFREALPVELQIEVPPNATVAADPVRFRQVLRSLLDNAVKFTPEGGHVAVYVRPNHTTGQCFIDVVDDGIGIGADSLPRVFDRFFQEDNSRTRRFGGMGMGLALVRRLCEAQGAVVSVESEPTKGSRFTLTWPMAADVHHPGTGDEDFHLTVAAVPR
jgi:signal transduction histidine kinase